MGRPSPAFPPAPRLSAHELRKLLHEHDQVLAELETARRRIAELTAELERVKGGGA